MFKISFKDNSKKVQVFNDRCTIVTLTGKVKIPNFLIGDYMPVWDWMFDHPSVDVGRNFALEELILTASGKAKCAEGDKFTDLGMMLAECRAKMRLYKFMRTLCIMLHDYHSKILTGTDATAFDHNLKLPSINRSFYNYCNLYAREQKHLERLLNTV